MSQATESLAGRTAVLKLMPLPGCSPDPLERIFRCVLYTEITKHRKEILMLPKPQLTKYFFLLLASLLAACSHPPLFSASEIDPPPDLVPTYVPQGYELASGFQLPPASEFPSVFGDDDALSVRIPGFDLKSPAGNDIQGVYYQGKDGLIVITKSSFPGGTLQQWREAYTTSQPGPCKCEFPALRLQDLSLAFRLREVKEERTVDGTQVAILATPEGWLSVFVRGNDLITVESAVSLDENLKIVSSLLEK
jgi:hypothetical protein